MFAAGYPMKYEKIAETLHITPSEVKRYVSELAERYNDDEHGIMILMFPETCQFCTKETQKTPDTARYHNIDK